MNHKVILAEDSLTIQKVIKHIFEKQPFDIVDCTTEMQLFERLKDVQPSLVLLDFNLSSNLTGYELTAKIREQVPTAKVILLLGTFDVVDDAAMEQAGASDKVVKPFDSNKLIASCKRLVDDAVVSDSPWSASGGLDSEAEEDQWTMNHSVEIKAPEQAPAAKAPESPSMNLLSKEVSDWGMSIPGVISDVSSNSTPMDIPPVIDDGKTTSEARPGPTVEEKVHPRDKAKERVLFPIKDDLDYPDLSATPATAEAPAPRKSPSLVPMSELKVDAFELELEGSDSTEETDVKQLEDLIRDEVEEDLWKADEFEDLKTEVSAKIEEVQHFQPSRSAFDESLFRPLDEDDSIEPEEDITPAAARDHFSGDTLEELRPEMEEMVKRYVHEYLDEMFRQKIEKVSWEVIPDLAENLIRQELGKIAGKILEEG